MKKLVLSAGVILGTALSVYATDNAIIKGTWSRKGEKKISLYHVENGRLEEVSTSKLDAQNRFGFYLEPKAAGNYVIGTGNVNQLTNKYFFYIKPKDAVEISVNDSSYTLVGKASAENQALKNWHDFVLPMERKAIYFLQVRGTYEDFFPELEAKVKELPNYKVKSTGNKAFDAFFAQYRDFNFKQIAASYLFTPRSKHPGKNDYPALYRNIKATDYTQQTSILEIPYALNALSNFTFLDGMLQDKPSQELDARLTYYKNDTLKGEIVIQHAATLKSYVGYEELIAKKGQYVLTADQKSRMKEIEARLAKLAAEPGKPAVNFTAEDVNGKKVSLSDFKGKVVIVDVWATWCGPCKAEIPSLKKMEEEFRGQAVEFVSVSIDQEKDKEKWKTFVAKEELKGVQIWAGTKNDITTNYEIKSIPRFMVFNKKGEVVSTDSPRPSNPELKQILLAELKK
ncbi:AhpC/TSA family protein [Chitinophaga skermanii]|uniref:AhpC/TSA family protein n=1 Tax=Chitinophaga skermanii TaxID=331697 RepID=A0A327QDF5_9BACT|nr:TlpA disulfide reductase family protein [Chitinophaga skermanii]RAJ01662.1 AhpC/TSA family protein [Chitinophaga skermanii]